MTPLPKRTALATIIGLYASTQLLFGQATNVPGSETTPISLPNQDSAHDGQSDNVKLDPLIANYTALKWEVTSVSLDYDVSQQVRISAGGSREQTSVASSKGSFSWSLGADGKMEGGISTKGQLSGDPFELFGLRKSGAEIISRVSASASARVQKERTSDEMDQSAMKRFLSITDDTAIGNLHLSFSVNIRNLSSSPLMVRLAPIPMIISDRHVANANPSDAGSDNVIEIPADRPDGVLVSFRADINNTKAFDLVRCLRNGDSPTIDLARSRITIKAKNDHSDVDLVSTINRIEQFDCLLTVRTEGGSVAWYIAPTVGLKPVTLRQAMIAINKMLCREAHVNQDFFEFGPTGLRNVAGYTGHGIWLLVSRQNASPVGVKSLDETIPKRTQINLLERNLIAANAQEVVIAPGHDAERRALERMRADFSLWKAAAEQNWPEGLYLIGQCYAYGIELSADKDKAFSYFRKAANSDWLYASVQVGDCFSEGSGVPKDEVEAVKWYRKVAEKGGVEGQRMLGDCYLGGRGVAKDEAEAVKWYRKAAEQGDALAQRSVGVCYLEGHGVFKDEGEAVRWYRKAAEQGDADAQSYLGNSYILGRGVSKDEDEAFKWYLKAANQGDPVAQRSVAAFYDEGIGRVAKDRSEAVEWFRKAAIRGDAMSQRSLGYYYLEGYGVAKDEAEAVKWFRKAAEQGEAIAQRLVGFCYLEGHGVSKDKGEAVQWYRRAADQGDEIAIKSLKQLRK